MALTGRSRTAWTLCLLLAAACSRERSATAPATTVDRRFVTGEAAAALKENGQIAVRSDIAVDGSEIDEQRAVQLASAYLHDYGALAQRQYEADRGAPINLTALAPCPRAFYAVSAYNESSAAISENGRRLIGGQWLVSFCNPGGSPEISVAVSSRATDLTTTNGARQLPNPGQNNFFSAGVPVRVAAVPPSPESIIALAATLTGKRVAKVPELILPLRPFAPQLARWHVTMESPVDVRGTATGAHERTAELYAGFGDTWQSVGLQRAVSSPSQQELVRDLVNGIVINVAITRREGTPHRYEPAVVEAP
jgi:hypothetical protein